MNNFKISDYWHTQIIYNPGIDKFQVVGLEFGQKTAFKTLDVLSDNRVYEVSFNGTQIEINETDEPSDWHHLLVFAKAEKKFISFDDIHLDGSTGIVGIDDIRPGAVMQYGCRLEGEKKAYMIVESGQLVVRTTEEKRSSYQEFIDDKAQAFDQTIAS